MSIVTTRRNATSTDPLYSSSQQGFRKQTSIPEPSKKKGRRGRPAVIRAEPQTQSIKLKTTIHPPRADAISNTAVSKRITRADRAAGAGSPLRAYEQPKRQQDKKRKRVNGQAASATPEPERKQPAFTQDGKDEECGIFFSESSENVLRFENFQLKAHINELQTQAVERDVRIVELENRITELEKLNARFSGQNSVLHDSNLDLKRQLEYFISQPSLHPLVQQLSSSFPPTSSHHFKQLSYRPQLRVGEFPTDHPCSEFDQDIMHAEESSPIAPVFVNSSESAIALLRKIENAAKEPVRLDILVPEDDERELTQHNNNTVVEPSSRHSVSHNSLPQPITPTPARTVASPSSFFSRSFSALKSKLGFGTSTPILQTSYNSQAAKPIASMLKPLPPSGTLTETLSLPPTPIGERTPTSSRKRKTDTLLKTFLKGVESNEKTKAEEWAKDILPRLKNDPAFREKRRRLETPVFAKDLENFPSSKPWETGFGDPLGDLDDEDVVPVWAVYLDMLAEEEQPMSKKPRMFYDVDSESKNILSINEQCAAGNGSASVSKLHDSHGHSASLLDFHPRRSTNPSPMFDVPVSHNQGANVFSELQGYNATAERRAETLECLKTPIKDAANLHNPTMGSFSVPDESDEEDFSSDIEISNADDAPLWTQPPPPAPVPAHAPLPGSPVADASSAPSAQQPVDEIERQRQKLMKHTPAKPSRLREATYPSPSLLSESGTELPSTPTPAYLNTSLASIFADMPTTELIELDDEQQASVDAFIKSEEYQQQMLQNPWPDPIISYESEEEAVSPI